MNLFDIFILIPLVIGGLNGLRKGLIKALANLVGWILALIVAAKYATVLSPSMVKLSEDPVVQKIAAFAFIVLMIVVLTWIVGAFLDKVLKKLKLGSLNRLAGGAFGTLKGLMVVLIGLQGFSPWLSESPTWKQSKFVQVLLPYAPWATEFSKEAAQDALEHIKSGDKSSDQSSKDTQETQKRSEDGTTNNPFY